MLIDVPHEERAVLLDELRLIFSDVFLGDEEDLPGEIEPLLIGLYQIGL